MADLRRAPAYIKIARFSRALIAPALAVAALSGCATGFPAQVSRFQQMPAAQGQSFVVVADDPRLAGGLEFQQYAALVAQKLGAVGYKPSEDPAAADLIVHMRYDVDGGRERVRSTGFGDPFYYRSGFGPYGWGGPFGWGPYGYYGRPWAWGYNDPFLFGGGYGEVESYTVYTSKLELRIDKTGGVGGAGAAGSRLFEGTASAQSLSNKTTYLVPKLIDAMFTGFPGNSGESVKITVPPEPKGK